MKYTIADPAQSGLVRNLHEILFSGAIASAFLTGLIASGNNYWTAQYFGWYIGLNVPFHRRYMDPVGDMLAFYIWFVALAICIFIPLRFFRRSYFTTMLLGSAGVIEVAAPVMSLWIVELCQPGYYWSATFLHVEGCAAVGCALLYRLNRWPVSTVVTVSLLTLHSILWVRAYSYSFIGGFWWSTAPVAAYLSLLVWGYYVKSNRPPIPGTTRVALS